MSKKPNPRRPEGLTDEEWALWVHLFNKWDPEQRVGMHTLKISPLSEPAKTAITSLAAAVGMLVSFPLEEGKHFIFAVRSRSFLAQRDQSNQKAAS